MRVLLVEDDTILGAAVRDQIVADGQSVDWVVRLDAAADSMVGAAYDLVLLDLMLPDGRGIAFLKGDERQPSWPVPTTTLAGGAGQKTGMPVWRAAPLA